MYIIIIVFCIISLPNRNNIDPRRAKKASSIQYGYRKWGTHARVFIKRLAHGTARMKENKETEKEDSRKE